MYAGFEFGFWLLVWRSRPNSIPFWQPWHQCGWRDRNGKKQWGLWSRHCLSVNDHRLAETDYNSYAYFYKYSWESGTNDTSCSFWYTSFYLLQVCSSYMLGIIIIHNACGNTYLFFTLSLYTLASCRYLIHIISDWSCTPVVINVMRDLSRHSTKLTLPHQGFPF